MSFDSFETSDESSMPIELYSATSGTNAFYFTSASFKIPHGGQVYLPTAVKRGGLKTDASGDKNDLVVELPSDHVVAQLFAGTNPNQPVNIVISRYQFEEGLSDILVFFEGLIRSVIFSGKSAKFTVVPIESSIEKHLPRWTFQSMCNAALYDDKCKAVRAAFDHDGTVIGVVGNEVTVNGADAFANGFFTGGEIVVGLERFWIIDHTGTVMTIFGQFVEDIAGEIATVYAGCAHDPTTCAIKFNNLINYRGYPYVPLKNIYESGIV